MVANHADERRFVNAETRKQLRLRRSEFHRNRCAERVPDDVCGRKTFRRDERGEVRDILFDAALRR